MKCLNIGCKNDLTPTDVSKMTFKNKYRFCRRCKQCKTQNLRYRCMLCGKIPIIWQRHIVVWSVLVGRELSK